MKQEDFHVLIFEDNLLGSMQQNSLNFLSQND